MEPIPERDADAADWELFPIGRMHIAFYNNIHSERVYYLRCRTLTGELMKFSHDTLHRDRVELLYHTYMMESLQAWRVHSAEFTEVVYHWMQKHAERRGVEIKGDRYPGPLPPGHGRP